jgi:hypothetical protein
MPGDLHKSGPTASAFLNHGSTPGTLRPFVHGSLCCIQPVEINTVNMAIKTIGSIEIGDMWGKVKPHLRRLAALYVSISILRSIYGALKRDSR